MRTRVLIAGAGITGLSTAYHLQKLGCRDYLLAEASAQPGGLCKSIIRQGFTFDHSGHVLHIHHPYTRKIFKAWLGSGLLRQPRRAVIYTHGITMPFPFQAHLSFLPEEIKQACLRGAEEAAQRPPALPATFKDWCLQSFGKGMYETFFRPYNTKLWGVTPEEMSAEWCGEFIPRPDLAVIRSGANGKPHPKLGYNPFFYYPRQGGCQALTDALAKRVKNLRLNAPVSQINWQAKTAVVGGESIQFDRLVSTLPLKKLLEIAPLPGFSPQLSCTSLSVLNVAVKADFNEFSWAYFPDEQDPFFRVGVQSSFSPQSAPEGCSSFYVELPGDYPHTQQSAAAVLSRLAQKGIIRENDVLFSFWQFLPYAYVVYTPQRTHAVEQAAQLLKTRGVVLAGRYGKWEYSFMERGFLQGKETAEALCREIE